MSVYEVVTTRIIQLIESKRELMWSKPWRCGQAINALTSKPYRGINSVVTNGAGYGDSRWVTINQANALGGRILKGEKATTIAFWKKNSEEEILKGNPKMFCRSYSIFNIEQTSGVELPPALMPVMNPNALEAAQDLIERYADKPLLHFGGNRAYYSPSLDRVQMPPLETFVSSERFFSVLAHEFAHSTLHESRLNRKFSRRPVEFKSRAYALEECVAQVAASFLSYTYGIQDLIEHDAAYIRGWLSVLRSDHTFIFKASHHAQRAVDYILGKGSGSDAEP